MSTKSILTTLIIVVILGYGIHTYNTIPTLEQSVQASWSQVENNYQRRMDLIPNLIETVKGAANFEKDTMLAVVEARTAVQNAALKPDQVKDPKAFEAYEQAQAKLAAALSTLQITIERYPDLKATQNYQTFQSQLEGTENRIAVARRDYIEAVRAYNTFVTTFPGTLFASMAGASTKPVFKATDEAAKVPAVKF